MFAGETIRTGAPATCPTCNITPDFLVYSSNAGYYIGTYCNCGPYTRESNYYTTPQEAEGALESGYVAWRGPLFQKVEVHGYVMVPQWVEIDQILGSHTVECILSNNCDKYSSCMPVTMEVYHTRIAD